MRSPGKRAAPRHRAPSGAAEDGADRPGGWRALTSAWRPRWGGRGARRARTAGPGHRLGPAVRRLMVTPTFAAGLGVLVAAGLAVNMPKTVLHFSSPVPGIQCSAGVCATEEPNNGTLASARPGVHIAPTTPATSGSTGQHRAGRRGGGPARPSGPDRRVTVTYRLTHQWPGGFMDEISITGMDTRRSWSLALGYPGARVTNVAGAQWQATSPDAGVAEGYPEPDSAAPGGTSGDGAQHRDPWGPSWVQFTIVLDGAPMAPVGCDFDGNPCTFRTSPQPQP